MIFRQTDRVSATDRISVLRVTAVILLAAAILLLSACQRDPKAGTIEIGHDFRENARSLEIVEPVTTFHQGEPFAWIAHLKRTVIWPADLRYQLTLTLENGLSPPSEERPLDDSRPEHGNKLAIMARSYGPEFTRYMLPGHYRLRILEGTEPLAEGDFTVVP